MQIIFFIFRFPEISFLGDNKNIQYYGWNVHNIGCRNPKIHQNVLLVI